MENICVASFNSEYFLSEPFGAVIWCFFTQVFPEGPPTPPPTQWLPQPISFLQHNKLETALQKAGTMISG